MRIWGGSGTEIRKKGKRAGLRGDGVETEAGLSAEPDGEGAEGDGRSVVKQTERKDGGGGWGGERQRGDRRSTVFQVGLRSFRRVQSSSSAAVFGVVVHEHVVGDGQDVALHAHRG